MEDRKAGMVPDVAMSPIQIRFGASGRAVVDAACERDKVSVSQYVRESALIRAWLESREADDEAHRALVAIYRAAKAEQKGRKEEHIDLAAYVRRLLDRP